MKKNEKTVKKILNGSRCYKSNLDNLILTPGVQKDKEDVMNQVFEFLHLHVFSEIPTLELDTFVNQVLEELGDTPHINVIKKIYLEAVDKEKFLRLGGGYSCLKWQ